MHEAKALRALKDGDKQALEWFIDRYTGYVSTVVNNIIGAYRPREDIEELVSDSFVALWQNAERVRGTGVKSYLSGIARNKAIDFLRSGGETELPLEEDALELSVPGPETEAEKSEERMLVRMAVLDMAHPGREIFLRHYFLFQSVADISDAMGIPTNTVKTHLRRGREKLKRVLERKIEV